MRPRFFALVATLALTGCIDAGSYAGASHNVEARSHHTLPASAVRQFDLTNIAGSIAITGWDRPAVDVSAVIYGDDQAAVNRTHVVVNATGSLIEVKTEYDKGNIFGDRNGAAVDYVVRIPKTLAVSVTNVSGPTTMTGLAGNVEATEISGRLEASLGRLAGTRNIHLSAVSGRVTVHIARDSSARVDASTLSGAINLFFPADTRQGMVGNSVNGRIGAGNASMTLHTVSGPIAVVPE